MALILIFVVDRYREATATWRPTLDTVLRRRPLPLAVNQLHYIITNALEQIHEQVHRYLHTAAHHEWKKLYRVTLPIPLTDYRRLYHSKRIVCRRLSKEVNFSRAQYTAKNKIRSHMLQRGRVNPD